MAEKKERKYSLENDTKIVEGHVMSSPDHYEHAPTIPFISLELRGLYYISNELADLNENIKELTETVKSANKKEETSKEILLEEYTDKGKATSSSSPLEEKVK